MWRDFFYYSKAERRVILLLLVLAVILIAANFYGKWKEQNETLEQAFTELPTDSLTKKQSIRVKDHPQKDTYTPAAVSQLPKPESQHVLSHFDPNTASREELCAQGIPSYVTNNILKYRAKGGKFRTVESLQKIYGMDEALYESVRHRVTIGKPYQQKERKSPPQFERIQKFPEGTIVNLNTADTTTLKRIPGIGSVYANRIVTYRKRLGGFYSVDQLQEIHGLDSTLNKWFETGNAPLRKIKVNRYNLDELRQHPYIGYDRAKSITDYRKRYGRIKDILTFGMFDSFTKTDIEKLAPYLSLE